MNQLVHLSLSSDNNLLSFHLWQCQTVQDHEKSFIILYKILHLATTQEFSKAYENMFQTSY